MARLFIFVLSISLMSVSTAHAVVVDFYSFFGIDRISRVDSESPLVSGITIENLSIVRDTQTTETGSGEASASSGLTNSFLIPFISRADLSVNAGPGLGTASARVLNILTFDILFPEPGAYYIETVIRHSAQPGKDLRAGEAASLTFDSFVRPDLDLSSFGPLSIAEAFRCPGFLCSPSFEAGGELMLNGAFNFTPGSDLRLPMTMLMEITLLATAIPEPYALALVLFGLASISIVRAGATSRCRPA